MFEGCDGSSTIHSATLPTSDVPAGGSIPTDAVCPVVRLLNSATPWLFWNGAHTVHVIRSPTEIGRFATATDGNENHSVHAKNSVEMNFPPDTTHCDPVPACSTSFDPLVPSMPTQTPHR